MYIGEIDYLIVGQGLSGTLVSHFLIEKGQSVRVLDHQRPQAASRVAAGLINPITGRHYVKSWRFDELLPIARATYAGLEEMLRIHLNEERPILRSLLHAGDENNWWARARDPEYSGYLVNQPDLGRYKGKIVEAHAYGEVCHSGRAAVGRLVSSFGEWLSERGWLIREEVDHQRFRWKFGHWVYGDLKARRVVFCEGYWGKFNPFFGYLPFRGAKGEILIVDMPEAGFQKILKNKIFIVPLEENRYWIGATMENQFENDNPTDAGKSFLLNQLEAFLRTPYTLVEHRSGIRPTVKDRRPFLGVHPVSKGLYIFNGLGSKGASMGPFFARQLVDYLIHGKKLDPEVDIRRFQDYMVT